MPVAHVDGTFSGSYDFSESFVTQLDRAPHLSSESAPSTIDASPSARQEAAILDAPEFLPRIRTHWPDLQRCHGNACSASSCIGVNDLIDDLVARVLPHVHIAGRRTLRLDDVAFQGCTFGGVANFPFIHWDQDWSMFPDAAGFQVWYMARAPPTNRSGSMFLVDTPELDERDPPHHWATEASGHLAKRFYTGGGYSMPIRGYADTSAARMGFRYVRMRAGEVLLFSKRTLHMTDPRPLLIPGGPAGDGRLNLLVRVVVRALGERTLPAWPQHIFFRPFRASSILQKRWLEGGATRNGLPQLSLGRHEWDDAIFPGWIRYNGGKCIGRAECGDASRLAYFASVDHPIVVPQTPHSGGTALRKLILAMAGSSRSSEVIVPCHGGVPCGVTETSAALVTSLLNRTACALAFLGDFRVLPLMRLLRRVGRGSYGPTRCDRWSAAPKQLGHDVDELAALRRTTCVVLLRDPLERLHAHRDAGSAADKSDGPDAIMRQSGGQVLTESLGASASAAASTQPTVERARRVLDACAIVGTQPGAVLGTLAEQLLQDATLRTELQARSSGASASDGGHRRPMPGQAELRERLRDDLAVFAYAARRGNRTVW